MPNPILLLRTGVKFFKHFFLFFFQALTVFTFAALIDSQILRGFSGPQDPRYEDYYMTPRIRYPVQLSLLCFAAACFNAVATLEAALSLLLGRLHRFMVRIKVVEASVFNMAFLKYFFLES